MKANEYATKIIEMAHKKFKSQVIFETIFSDFMAEYRDLCMARYLKKVEEKMSLLQELNDKWNSISNYLRCNFCKQDAFIFHYAEVLGNPDVLTPPQVCKYKEIHGHVPERMPRPQNLQTSIQPTARHEMV